MKKAALYAKIIPGMSNSQIDKMFDYEIPFEMLDKIETGMRVKVPFGGGNSLAEGYVIDICDSTDVPEEKIKLELKTLRRAYAESLASNVSAENNFVATLDYVEMDELRDFANKAVKNVGGILVALIGEDGDYKYVMASQTIDLRAMSKDINSKLNGRGGGHPQMIQGSLFTDIEKIKEYFDC